MQHAWDEIRGALPSDEASSSFILLFVYPTVLYWIVGLLYLFVDLQRPKAITQFKIQEKANSNLSIRDAVSAARQILSNQLLIGFIYFCTFFHLRRAIGFDDGRELPSPSRVLLDFLVFLVMEELLFYYFHRLLHHPRVYKVVHKKHHEWTAPIAITAMYCHPIEHMLSNLLPVAVGK